MAKGIEARDQADSESSAQPRLSTVVTGWLLAGWVGLFTLLMIEPTRGFLDYFAERDPRFRFVLGGLLAGLLIASWAYSKVRVRGLWKREPVVLAAVALALTAVYAPWGLALVGLMTASFFVVGKTLLGRLEVSYDSTSAELALSVGAGVGLLLVVLIPIGLAGLYGRVLFAVLLLLPLLLFSRRLSDLGRCLAGLNRAWAETPEVRSPLVGVGVVFVGFLEVVLLLAAVTPTITQDATFYHVPAAQYYLDSGFLAPLPSLPVAISARNLFTVGHSTAYSYYPQSYEELLTVALSLGGWPAMQLTGPLFYLLGLLAVSAIGRTVGLTRFERVIGLVGAMSLPFAHWSGSTIKNDMATASFQILALYCVLQARKKLPPVWIVLAATFLGLSFGTKHIALFGGIPIALLIASELWNRERRWKWTAIVALAFVMSGTFWHARAYVMKGSPVYPANATAAVHQYVATDGSVVPRSESYLTYLWIAHFEGSKVIELPMQMPCGLFLAFLVIAWPLTRKRQSSATWAIALYLALYYAYWVWVWGVLRYGIAPFFVVAMLIGGRAAALWLQSGQRNRLLITMGLALGLLAAVAPILTSEVNPPQIRYLSGTIDRDGYLEEANRFYPSMRELKRVMKPDESAISIANCAVAYFEDPSRIQCVLPDRRATAWVSVVEVLREHTPDYLVVSGSSADRHLVDVLPEVDLHPVYEDPFFRIYAHARSGG
ncbi:MAG: hypothetical protein O3A53_09870 [Acidobacteria bacterium]|nr:hypothetical protein [Acidobacteriota bacterium]MDA1235099.1 hypothetical protein [Acidobacteriota bacterium]